jgi:hypothetical protein
MGFIPCALVPRKDGILENQGKELIYLSYPRDLISRIAPGLADFTVNNN